MRILVTGGTGVIGAGVLPELLKQGHFIRLLSRRAERGAADYPENVEPCPASIADPEELRGSADGCDAVIHIAGIVEPHPPKLTFETINVNGTRHIIDEAKRAGARRLIYISSLGADRGQSDYHKSKRAAEQLVQESDLEWTILRPGNVYGPGDEVISMLLKLVRSLPVVPVIGSGEQRFQPLWFEDAGRAIAATLECDKSIRKTLEIAGDEITTTREIIEKLGQITNRGHFSVPVPVGVTSAVARLTERFDSLEKLLERSGLTIPISSNKLQMLVEENIIEKPAINALSTILGLKPTSLDSGLRLLADELPELLPDEGVGTMEQKQFTVEIENSKLAAKQLLTQIRENINALMPVELDVEPGTPDRVEPGETLTGNIPGRGHFQVRVLEVQEDSFSFITVEGHPLAGMVTFQTEDTGSGRVRFTIETNSRPANVVDWLAMRLIGGPSQAANWRNVADRVVALSGGQTLEGVCQASKNLSEREADEITNRIRSLARQKVRHEHTLN